VLKSLLLHPEILRALAAAGHGARILIADGNFPVSTETPVTATRVYLNLRRGLVSVPDVLETLVTAIQVESAIVMSAPDDHVVPIHEKIRSLLPETAALTSVNRHEFYAEAKSHATTLVIATGEERRFANIILVIAALRAGLPGEP
jgi:L-fucose mutarotase